MNGPSPLNVSTNPASAATKASTKRLKSSVSIAISTIFFCCKDATKSIADCGNNTLLIRCPTPFDAIISVAVMFALVSEASPITKVSPSAIISIELSANAVPTAPAFKSAANTLAGTT